MMRNNAVAELNNPDQAGLAERIWCPHYECFKYLNVCNRCRVRIKCLSYQDYWAPRFDF
jgi:hypothetical protein